MAAIKILIVEDELISAKSMKSLLEKRGYEITGLIPDGEDVLDSMEANLPDLIIMDIHLKGNMDGITTAKIIRKIYNLPLIFITQAKDESLFKRAKETFPKHYIPKPFSDLALLSAIELTLQDFINEDQKPKSHHTSQTPRVSIFIPAADKTFLKVFFNDILYLESDHVYTKIFLDKITNPRKNEILVAISSNHVAEQINHPDIIKIHKSYHVNLHKITNLKGNRIFINDTELPLSESHHNEVYNRLEFLRLKNIQK